ncbi:hypothetical protein CANCADRAFT_20917 [Tortispora caseinolytica NRRL Y-17796]|uniref:Protein YTP1-like C-terminal domain-containing protein n=1 Tax=Tortispora caseinolytica NRRL Y-17796 TaxID=767744 RepID=A0A1E4TLT5_9ASCO|nr:hypothetical protein CANCADRAFT_20917 [Tortispora caseinolytica NRRL Y-17796]
MYPLQWLLLAGLSWAHEHHVDLPPNEYTTDAPLDVILWIHIAFMTLSFAILFPIGMVLGLARNRFHAPVQITAISLVIVAYFLGHHHKGRQFKSNIHSQFVPTVMLMIIIQGVLGVFLKLHIERGPLGKVRPPLAFVHSWLGKLCIPLVGYVQMGFGVITSLGFCHGVHLGQCLAHGIMGSAFIGYGCVLAVMMYVGQPLLRRTGRPQEFYDSWVILAWGIVNTFTEHRWGQPWSHGDYQHTSMGIVWWCGGILGVFLSMYNSNRRSLIPAIIIIVTGWSMSVHHQNLEISTRIHAMFGYVLMSAGLCRIIEISFVLKDAPAPEYDQIKSFQHLTPFFLVTSGVMFMGANEEQLILLDAKGVGHSSYTLILFSFGFIAYFLILLFINLYIKCSGPNKEATEYTRASAVEEFELSSLADSLEGDHEDEIETR